MNNILPTTNRDWGFWGTALLILDNEAKTEKSWNIMSKAIKEITGISPEQTCQLLDSRWGRHTADFLYDSIKNGSLNKDFRAHYDKIRLLKEYKYYVGNLS